MKRLSLILLPLLVLSGCGSEKAAASIQGAEWERLILEDTEYIRDASDRYQNYSIADKGSYLANAHSGKQTFRIYSIQDDPERNFLYVQWDFEGEIYVRKDITEESIQ